MEEEAAELQLDDETSEKEHDNEVLLISGDGDENHESAKHETADEVVVESADDRTADDAIDPASEAPSDDVPHTGDGYTIETTDEQNPLTVEETEQSTSGLEQIERVGDNENGDLLTDAEAAESAEVPSALFEDGEDENQQTREQLADDLHGAVRNIPVGDEMEDEQQETDEHEDEMLPINDDSGRADDDENQVEMQAHENENEDQTAHDDETEDHTAHEELIEGEGYRSPSLSPKHSRSLYSPGTSSQHLGIEEDGEDQEEEEETRVESYGLEQRRNREQLLEKYHQALAERQQLRDTSDQLQHRLSEHFRHRRSDDVRYDERSTADQEQRYLKYMASLDELHRQEIETSLDYRQEIAELADLCELKVSEVDRERQELMERKRLVCLSAVSNRSGKPIQAKDVEQFLATDNRKECEVVSVRLENIRLKNQLKKKEAQLKSKEELSDGLHLIDFEQLKIENQTYNEKIEERNEELQKLRRKITSTVQVLTHLKEKLQYVQVENQLENSKLQEIEERAAKKRDALSRTKQVRDSLRIDNQRLHQNAGLLGSAMLLRDFEERHDDIDELTQRLTDLKTRHADLTLNLNSIRRKITAASDNATR